MIRRFACLGCLAAAAIAPAAAQAQNNTTWSRLNERTQSETPDDGYDFEHVVERLETSVTPLQTEMDETFGVFVATVQEAEVLLENGQRQEAIRKFSQSIDSVLAIRDDVMEPMWEGQSFLTDQIANVRARLARAVDADRRDKADTVDRRTEAILDGIAKRIAEETDAKRKSRLIAHYRTIRSISQIKRMAEQLTPEQQRLWASVLRVLEEAAMTHQKILVGAEVLFSQFEATAGNLNEYVALLDTVDGAQTLFERMNNEDMKSAVARLAEVGSRMHGLQSAIDRGLRDKMTELEATLESVNTNMDESFAVDGVEGPSDEVDDELADRLRKFQNP